MSDDTVPQFGRSLREQLTLADIASVAKPAASPAERAARSARATSCPTCSSHFSPDGRFCPFDGTPLVAAVGWDPSANAMLGTVIDGRYEILSVLGEGGMGTVYEVRHRSLGKRFALKALRKDLALDGEIAARFIQEARTAAAVSHPGLVEITDFGRIESGQVYFVMELLEGQSLAALLRSGPLPAARSLAIVRQLAHALKAAHDANIVHRDLKPDNIHIARGDTDNDVVKIVDFGLAKVIGASKLTRDGMVFGTPHYMSPEQAAGEPVDHRADIYALGVVMYEMFTGKVPFEADSYMGVLTKHMYMAPAPPSQLSHELKSLGTLEHVILCCLQKRPGARYENLSALLTDLEQRLPNGGSSRVVPTSLLADQLELPSSDAAELRGGFRYWPAVAVGLAFVAGVALVVLLRSARPPSTQVPSAEVNRLPASSASHAAGAAGAMPPAAVSTSPEPTPAPKEHAESGAPHAPARKPNPVSQRPQAAPAQKAAPKRRLGAGEIVDPWAH